MAESDSTVVTLPEVHVMYLQSPNGIVGAMEVWHAFVDRLPAPVEQWAFYGTYLHAKNEYRACAAIPPGDDFEALGLATFTIPGGRYASAVLKDWEQHIPEIGTTFERLSKEYTADPARPTIEQYRDGPDVLLCLPIVSE